MDLREKIATTLYDSDAAVVLRGYGTEWAYGLADAIHRIYVEAGWRELDEDQTIPSGKVQEILWRAGMTMPEDRLDFIERVELAMQDDGFRRIKELE